MLDTTKENTYFTKLKAGGRFAIYTFGIYLAATFTIGCLGLAIGSPLLTFPLTMLISHPAIWVVTGIVLAVAYKVAVKLFHLVKDHVHGKRAPKEEKSEEKGAELQKSQEKVIEPQKSPEGQEQNANTPDRDSGVVPGSEPGSENSSRRNSDASEDSGLGDKEFRENLDTLVHQTNRGNYTYWLQQHDIARIARIKYRYSEGLGDNTFFCIPGDVSSLNSRLKEYKNEVEAGSTRKTFTSVINLGGNHWVTLVVVYNSDNKQFRAYYCDSSGHKLPDKITEKIINDISLANCIDAQQIKPLTDENDDLIRNSGNTEIKKNVGEALRCVRSDKNELVDKNINTEYIVGILQVTLEIDDKNNIRSSRAEQQNDGCNCGIFALVNASKITQMLGEGKSFDEIDKELLKREFDLNEKRREFAEALMNDEQWKEELKTGVLCDLPLETQTSLTSGVQNVQTCNAI